MGLFRNDHNGVRYQMREKLVAIGDDYWIEDAGGNKIFKVDGKAVRARDTFILEDAHGHEVAKIQERKLAVRDTMKIERDGATIATVKKALVNPLHDRFHVEIEGGGDWSVHGNIVDHQYTIKSGHDKIAEVSKKWFRVRDTYGIEVAPQQDDALVIAVTVAFDDMEGLR